MSSQIENLVTSCPQCNSLVGLPSIMSLDAQVRCPVCHHKYTLRARLPQQIPQLELVVESEESGEEVNSSIAIDPTAKLEVSEILRKNAKLSRRRRHRRSHREGERQQPVSDTAQGSDNLLAVNPGEEASFEEFQAAASAANPPRRHRSRNSGHSSQPKTIGPETGATAQLQTAGELAAYERQSARRASSRRSSSVSTSSKNDQWVEIAKVVVGALLALPVAQLIIWWVLSVDPLRLAPTVAKVVPFVVPAKVLEAEQEE